MFFQNTRPCQTARIIADSQKNATTRQLPVVAEAAGWLRLCTVHSSNLITGDPLYEKLHTLTLCDAGYDKDYYNTLCGALILQATF